MFHNQNCVCENSEDAVFNKFKEIFESGSHVDGMKQNLSILSNEQIKSKFFKLIDTRK